MADARWQRLTVLGCLTFLAQRLAEEEGTNEALARLRHLLSIAEDPSLDDETSVLNLQRALDTKDSWNTWIQRETYEQGVADNAPLVAAMIRIADMLRPQKLAGGSVFGKVIGD